MISILGETDRKAVAAIANDIAPFDNKVLEPLLANMKFQTLGKDEILFDMGRRNDEEYFVLSGLLRTYVLNPGGDEITLHFAAGPGVLPPSISRSIDGVSQVSCDALAETSIASFTNEQLIELMMTAPEVQHWGDAVMRAELVRRTEREIALATMTAKQRLEQFRLAFPTLEQHVSHSMIASYLGITPVTLSRLRNG